MHHVISRYLVVRSEMTQIETGVNILKIAIVE
jgi:hypothetical protein